MRRTGVAQPLRMVGEANNHDRHLLKMLSNDVANMSRALLTLDAALAKLTETVAVLVHGDDDHYRWTETE